MSCESFGNMPVRPGFEHHHHHHDRDDCGCNSCGCNNCGCSDGCGCNKNCGCNDGCGCNNCSSNNNCGCNGCGQLPDGSACSRFIQPILCNQARFSCAGTQDGATLVIHKIVLEPCGNQSCTPRTFNIRVTGPSFPCGEVFQLRAGNCLELDEPLVITGLTPGTYRIEELFACPNEFISTLTGPVCGGCVNLTCSCAPTVVTIVNRKRLCRLCHGSGCGCGFCSTCCNT